jgi:hypothetical protein
MQGGTLWIKVQIQYSSRTAPRDLTKDLRRGVGVVEEVPSLFHILAVIFCLLCGG